MDFQQLARSGFFAMEGETEKELLIRYEKERAKGMRYDISLDIIEKETGVRPDWVFIAYNSDKTSFLQPAVTEIDDIPCVYVRKSPRLMGEFLPHELIHAVRAPLKGDLFEEVAAYAIHPRWVVRFFGPLFSRAWEPWAFLGFYLTGAILLPFALMPGLFCMFGPLVFAFTRLFWLHYLWNRAKTFLGSAHRALFWMDDEEVKNFASAKKSHSLRWKQLLVLYPELHKLPYPAH